MIEDDYEQKSSGSMTYPRKGTLNRGCFSNPQADVKGLIIKIRFIQKVIPRVNGYRKTS